MRPPPREPSCRTRRSPRCPPQPTPIEVEAGPFTWFSGKTPPSGRKTVTRSSTNVALSFATFASNRLTPPASSAGIRQVADPRDRPRCPSSPGRRSRSRNWRPIPGRRSGTLPPRAGTRSPSPLKSRGSRRFGCGGVSVSPRSNAWSPRLVGPDPEAPLLVHGKRGDLRPGQGEHQLELGVRDRIRVRRSPVRSREARPVDVPRGVPDPKDVVRGGRIAVVVQRHRRRVSPAGSRRRGRPLPSRDRGR